MEFFLLDWGLHHLIVFIDTSFLKELGLNENIKSIVDTKILFKAINIWVFFKEKNNEFNQLKKGQEHNETKGYFHEEEENINFYWWDAQGFFSYVPKELKICLVIGLNYFCIWSKSIIACP